MVIFVSQEYTRKELASRIGVFYAALTASSAFGGFLAYDVFHPDRGWALFPLVIPVLEGGLTLLCGVITAFILLSGPQSAWFLKPIEKQIAILRFEQDSVHSLPSQVCRLLDSASLS